MDDIETGMTTKTVEEYDERSKQMIIENGIPSHQQSWARAAGLPQGILSRRDRRGRDEEHALRRDGGAFESALTGE